MSNPYIIGTRGSLLAKTQCQQIKDELENITGKKFELKFIKTQGDLVTDKPLWQMDGKDFFTKELDSALIRGEVDLVVHSYKDLGSQRPDDIKLAAITKRDYAHDILLIRKDVLKDIQSKTELIIGTSSPRRVENITTSFGKYIPNGQSIEIKTKMLRGNVNSRIEKLRSKNYDAIILALAGLERLAKDEEASKILKKLLEGLTFAVLPQSVFPSAASQGALAIECNRNRKDNHLLEDELKKIHCQKTEEEVLRERKIFNSYGGGCHLAVGVSVSKKEELFIHSVAGVSDNKKVKEYYIEKSKNTSQVKDNIFIGLPKEKVDLKDEIIYDQFINKTPLKISESVENKNVFIASTYGVDKNVELLKNTKSIWTSGVKTWEKLAKKGLWVHGSSDSLGEKVIESFKKSKVISILLEGAENDWPTLSKSEATSTLGPVFESYKTEKNPISDTFLSAIENCNHFYWSSYTQYLAYLEKFPSIKGKNFYCGTGKTYESFKKNNIVVTPIISVKELL